MFTTERYTAEIPVKKYLEQYVDVEGFLECCRECPNYDRIWSCPSYDFDVLEYWKQYETLELTAVKIVFDGDYAGKPFSEEELDQISKASIGTVKQQLSQELYAREAECPGSISLSAGSCSLCSGNCTREKGEVCRFPEKMRYSIEALGGNVGLTISRLMGLELEWMEEGRLPSHFVLVCGLLQKYTKSAVPSG